MSKPQLLQDRPQQIFVPGPPHPTSAPAQPSARPKPIKKPRSEALKKAEAKAAKAKATEPKAAKPKAAKPKKAKPKKKARLKKPEAMVYSFDEIPMAHQLIALYGFEESWLATSGYLSKSVDIDLFERVPEPAMTSDEIKQGFSLQRIIHELLLPARHALDVQIGSTYKYGYHYTATLEEVSDSFGRANIRAIRLSEAIAARSQALDKTLTVFLEQLFVEGLSHNEMLVRLAEDAPEEELDILAERHSRFCALLAQRGIDPLEAMVSLPADTGCDYGIDGWIYLAHALMQDDRLIDLAMADPSLQHHRLNYLLSQIHEVAKEAKSLQKRLQEIVKRDHVRPHISAALLRKLGVRAKKKAKATEARPKPKKKATKK